MNMLFRPRVNGTVCVEDLYKELTAARPVVLVQDHWLERPVLMLPMQFINPDTLASFQAVSQGALEAVIPFDMPRREAADDEILPTSRLGFLMSLVRDETVPSYSSGFTLRFARRQRFRACADVYEAALALCTASGLVARALLAPLALDQTVTFGEDHGYKTAYIKDVQAFAKKDQFGNATSVLDRLRIRRHGGKRRAKGRAPQVIIKAIFLERSRFGAVHALATNANPHLRCGADGSISVLLEQMNLVAGARNQLDLLLLG